MKLDQVVTIAIGRIDKWGTPLSDNNWAGVREMVFRDCTWYGGGGTVVAFGDVVGVTSDQDEEQEEESYIVVVVNPADISELRRELARTLRAYNLSSACFANDINHEPVFATADGFRRPVPTVTAAAYAPTHGGYAG